MPKEYQIPKDYQIPHNFKNSGRVFNLIEKNALTKALIWLIPITIIIFKFMPLRIDNKFFVEVIVGFPPVLAFSLGMDLVLMDIMKFNQNRKVYYNIGSEVNKVENHREYQGAYERAKKQEVENKRK